MRALMKPNYQDTMFPHAFAAPPRDAREDLIC